MEEKPKISQVKPQLSEEVKLTGPAPPRQGWDVSHTQLDLIIEEKLKPGSAQANRSSEELQLAIEALLQKEEWSTGCSKSSMHILRLQVKEVLEIMLDHKRRISEGIKSMYTLNEKLLAQIPQGARETESEYYEPGQVLDSDEGLAEIGAQKSRLLAKRGEQ